MLRRDIGDGPLCLRRRFCWVFWAGLEAAVAAEAAGVEEDTILERLLALTR